MVKFLHDVSGYKMEIELIETETPPDVIKDDPKNVFFNFKEMPNFLLRKQVYNMLVYAKTKLPKGLYFKGFETYRPMSKQIEYWNDIVNEIKTKFPDISEEKLIEYSETYIANPYKQGSGHQTGAAIDLTLCDENGEELDMGTKWKDHTDKVYTYCNSLTLEQYKNRNILIGTMLSAGFINYFEEWWHYSWGELEWALMTRVGKTKFLKLDI